MAASGPDVEFAMPSAPRRSKVCAVCRGESETFHLNYGVGTCNSCRAFFRRSVQSDAFGAANAERMRQKCKTDGNCLVSAATRKKCRWCRFSACLAAGMNTSNVLREEEKRVRFRKAIMKRKAEGGEVAVVEPASKRFVGSGFGILTFGKSRKGPGDFIQDEYMEAAPMAVEQGTQTDPELAVDYDEDEVSEADDDVADVIPAKTRIPDGRRCVRIRDYLRSRLTLARDTWKGAVRRTPVAPDFAEAMVGLHLGFSDLLQTRMLARHLKKTLSTALWEFAVLQPEVQVLDEEQREKLVGDSAALFAQYIMSGYLSRALNGHEQLEWMFLGRQRNTLDALSLGLVTPDVFNGVTRLFEGDDEMDTYLGEIAGAGDALPERPEAGLVALACILKGTECFDDALTLSEFSNEVYGVGATAEELRFGIGKLENAAAVMEKWAYWGGSGNADSSNDVLCFRNQEIRSCYSPDEELAVLDLFRTFDDAYGSMPLPPVLVSHLLDFAGGRPLSVSYGETMFFNLRERLTRVLLSCEGVEADAAQIFTPENSLRLQINLMHAVAVHGARMESYPTVSGQIRHWIRAGAMPEIDFDAPNDSQLTVIQVNSVNQRLVDEDARRLRHLLATVGELVQDPATFRLLLLVLLTDGLRVGGGRSLQTEYISLLRRRVRFLDDVEGEENGDLIESFTRGIGHVREMAALIIKFKEGLQQQHT